MPLPTVESLSRRREGEYRPMNSIEKTKPVYLLQPWNDLDGRLSVQVFGVYITTLVDLIFSQPGIMQGQIIEHFVHRIVSPVRHMV